MDETEEIEEIQDTEDNVMVLHLVENAQRKNYDEAVRNLFYPVRPWISVHEYRKAEEHYKEEFLKQELVGNKLNEAEEIMVAVKIRNGVRGKSIEDGDQIGNGNGEGETQSMQADNPDKTISSEDNNDSKDHTILQITNLPQLFGSENLQDLLSQFGRIIEIYVGDYSINNDMRSKFAIIKFENQNSAENALDFFKRFQCDFFLIKVELVILVTTTTLNAVAFI